MSSKGDGDRRVAVVTGGAGAIGGAIVARLAPDHTVVVLDRTGDVVVDLGDTDDVRRAAELVLDRHGRCDVFVHAAATFAFGPLEQVDLDVWRQIQAVNVESALLLTQAFVPGMQERGFGRVIFIVSNTFWSPPDGQMLPYVASKGALIGMTRTLAVGLGGDGIAVTAVAPGLTHTPASATRAAAEFADTEAHMALHRPLTPDDTAAVVGMLARDEAEALTGQTLTADGGLVMR
jgi:NAD(P)-dependent dehydrogenase (short-subunit alcohol dehydrogenase family)